MPLLSFPRESPALLVPLDSWDPQDSKGNLDIPASLDLRVTAANQVPLAAAAVPVPRVSQVLWDPKEDPDPLATLDLRDLQASLVQLEYLQWA